MDYMKLAVDSLKDSMREMQPLTRADIGSDRVAMKVNEIVGRLNLMRQLIRAIEDDLQLLYKLLAKDRLGTQVPAPTGGRKEA